MGIKKNREYMTQDLRPIPYNGYQRRARNTNTTGWDFKEEHTVAISDSETVYIPFQEERAIAIRDNTSTKIPTKDLRPILYNQYQRRARNTNTIAEHAIAKTQYQKAQREHREELTTKIPTKDLRPIPYNQYQRRVRNTNTIEEHTIAIRDNTSTKTQNKKNQREHREELTTKILTKDLKPIPYNQYQRRARNTNTIEERGIAIS